MSLFSMFFGSNPPQQAAAAQTASLTVPQQVCAEVLRLCDQQKIPRPPQAIADCMSIVAASLWEAEEKFTTEISLVPDNRPSCGGILTPENVESYIEYQRNLYKEHYLNVFGPKRDEERRSPHEFTRSHAEYNYLFAMEDMERNLNGTAKHENDRLREHVNKTVPLFLLRAAKVAASYFNSQLSVIFLVYLRYIASHLPSSATYASTTIACTDILEKDVGALIMQMMKGINAADHELFAELKSLIAANREPMDKRQKSDCTGWLGPNSRLSPIQMVDAVFGGTAMRQLFDVEIPGPEPTVPDITERDWYSHCLSLASTGNGKTNVIRWRIAQLLPQVAQGHASLVLMEPKGVLTDELLHLAQVWNMRDRLVILDPADTSVSVNLFDKGDGSPQTINETIGRVSRIFSTITSTLTAFQRTTLTFALRAIFALPGTITMRTLTDVLRKGIGDIPLHDLTPAVRDFFQHDFEANKRSAAEIISRLNGLLADPVFEALFAGDRTTFDMFDEIQSGKLIVINASAADSLYGRFWIEEVARCIRPRLAVPIAQRKPTTFIMDEAQTFISEDLHFAEILDTAREARIGMLIAAHHMAQIEEPRVRDSIYTNTRLKFIARTSADLRALCQSMGTTDADFISTLNQYEFAYFGPNMQQAIKVKFPLVEFERMPQMAPAQYAALRDLNRKRYAYVPEPPPSPAPEPPRATPALDLAGARAALEKAVKDADWARAGELQHSIIPALERQGTDTSEPKPSSPAPEVPPPQKGAPPGSREATRDWC